MKNIISKNVNEKILPRDTVEVKIFQNSTNKQFNLPVLKKNTSPNIIKNIFNNKNIVGFKFEITDLIFKNGTNSSLSNTHKFKKLKGVEQCSSMFPERKQVGSYPSTFQNERRYIKQ